MGRSANFIYLEIKQQIESKIFKPGEYLPAIRILSEKYEVATGTLHKALKKLSYEGLIMSENRKGFKVQDPRDERLDGLPIIYANIKEKKIKEELHTRQFRETFEVVARKRGVQVLPMDCHGNELDLFLKRIQIMRVGGLVLDAFDFNSEVQHELVKELQLRRIPVVLLDSVLSSVEVDCVLQDNFSGGYQAAQWACQKGYDDFFWLGEIVRSYHGRERFGGVAAGLQVNGFHLKNENINLLSYKSPEDIKGIKAFLKEQFLGSTKKAFIFSLWSGLSHIVSEFFQEHQLTLGPQHGFIGWSIDELFEVIYRDIFVPRYIPPVVAWKAYDMATQVIDRLVYRRKHPDEASIRSLVPIRIYA